MCFDHQNICKVTTASPKIMPVETEKNRVKLSMSRKNNSTGNRSKPNFANVNSTLPC
jgi:hypothetical protein